MLYSIIAEDHENSLENRLKARPEHIARLEALQADGRLIIAGPFPAIDSHDPGPAGFSGSLIIAEFDNLEAANEWANNDPYVIENVYARVKVLPFRKTLPA